MRKSTLESNWLVFAAGPRAAGAFRHPLAILLSALLIGAAERLPAQEVNPSVTPRMIQSTEEILSDWQPHQHLYVRGNLGLGAEQLAQLEQWLDQNGTNWVVVLMESAAGESFTDAQGRRWNGMDAVEHRLGTGLPGRTGFGNWTDPRTGERNGAFFVLFLKERKFSYYGSDAQDKRALGEDRWQGRLDQPAIAAMRGGGRIIDAAKDTVASINQKLDEKIAAEEREKQQAITRAEARKAELKTKAEGSITGAGEAVARLENQIARVRSGQPGLVGSIVQPDTVSWKAQLASAERNFENGDFAAALTLAQGVTQRVSEAAQALEAYAGTPPFLDNLQTRLTDLSRSPFASSVRPHLRKAEEALTDARRTHAVADPAYVQYMEQSRQSLNAADVGIQSALRMEQQQRRAMIAAGVGGTSLLLLLAVVLNRRRRASRRDAVQLLEAWTKALDEKTVSAYGLLHRSIEMLGDSRLEAEQRFAGRTLALVQQIIRDVDEMVIMSGCAGRVLGEARELARPAAWSARTVNLFFRRRYRAAVRRLRDEPVVFQPDEGIVRALAGKRTERDRLLGTLESYEPFRLSFNELIAGFNERAGRALNALDQLESGQLRLADLLVEVEKSLDQTRSAAAELEQSVTQEGLLPVRDVQMHLLPVATATHSDAAVLSIQDPLEALDSLGARAREQAEDARLLVALATDFHSLLFRELETGSHRLEELGLDVNWVGAALGGFSQTFSEVAQRSVTTSQAEEIGRLRAGLDDLAAQLARTVELERKRVEVVLPAIDGIVARLASTRDRLARELSLMSDELLLETGRNPDHHLRTAREQTAATHAALNRGDVEAAESALAAADRELAEAAQWIKETETAFERHAATVDELEKEGRRLRESLPAHEAVLRDIESTYADAVLLLGAGDPAHPFANGTITDNMQETAALLDQADQLLRAAREVFQKGRVLGAADALSQAGGCQRLGALRLQEIVDKQKRLSDAVSANGKTLATQRDRLEHLETRVQDPRTMRGSQDRFAHARDWCTKLAHEMNAPRNDPFELAEKLARLTEEIGGTETQVAGDWASHQEASQSLTAGDDQLRLLDQLAEQSTGDGHPDSLLTRDLLRQANELKQHQSKLKNRLNEPHGDWFQLDREADDLGRQAGLVAARLRRDLEAARDAHDRLQEAVAQVRLASHWTGGHGVKVSSLHGADLVAEARQCYLRGDYSGVVQTAGTARRMAQQAIAEAEAEVRRRELAEQQRLALERRRRQALAAQLLIQAASRSTFGSSSKRSGFGSSVGRSGFGSGSGVSRSSFGGGSGTSRSGW